MAHVDCIELISRRVAEDSVKLYALQVLVKKSKKGVEHAVEIVATRLKHSSNEVRLAALQAIVAVADKDDAKALKGVWTCAEAPAEEVQLAAERL